MKHLLGILMVFALTWPVTAQQQGDDPVPLNSVQMEPPPPPSGGAGFEEEQMGPPGMRRGWHDGKPREDFRGRNIERWMNLLKKEDPLEYERFQQLKQENPEQFRHELRNRLQQHIIKQHFRGLPEVERFLSDLTPSEREQLLKKLTRAARRYEHEDKALSNKHTAEYKMLEKRARKLARQYRRADEDERGDIKQELRELLNQQFDLKEQDRQAGIERLRTQLSRLERELQERSENKAALVEQHLDNLIHGPPPSQRKPPSQ